MSFSSGSESRDRIWRADLLRKRVPSRRGGVCERPLTVGYCTDRWTTEDTNQSRKCRRNLAIDLHDIHNTSSQWLKASNDMKVMRVILLCDIQLGNTWPNPTYYQLNMQNTQSRHCVIPAALRQKMWSFNLPWSYTTWKPLHVYDLLSLPIFKM